MSRSKFVAAVFLFASIVVQASQCTRDAECPSDDEPQNGVSLIQAKLQTNVIEEKSAEAELIKEGEESQIAYKAKSVTDPIVAVATVTKAPKVFEYPTAPVFYSIFMGEYAGRHQARLWMSSLRDVGKWKGTIMMTSDKPDCLANVIGEELLGGKLESSTENVFIYPGTGPNGRVHLVRGFVKHKGGGLDGKEFKRQKQLAWDHTNEAQFNHDVSLVVYTDEDIVFGKDLTEAMQEIRQTEAGNYTLSLFQDQGCSKGELHTGIVVSYPSERSKNCLAAWMETLKHYVPLAGLISTDQQSLGIDQQSLGLTGKCNRHINSLTPKFLKMPDKSSCEHGVGAEFVHFTNTYRAGAIPKGSQEKYFYHHLGLNSNLDVFGKTSCD